MGDVTDYASPRNFVPLTSSIKNSLIFQFKNRQVIQGERLNIDITSRNFKDIYGFQGTLRFETSKIKFKDFHSGSFKLSTDLFNFEFINRGLLSMLWYNASKSSFDSDLILFSLEVEALQDGDLCDALSFTSDLTPAEAYTDSLLIKNIKIESCDVIIKNKETVSDQIKMYPNPAEDILHFDFPKEATFPLQLDLYSKDGKTIIKIRIPTQQENFNCKLNQFPSGMYFIKISERNRVTFRKFIKI